jgi:hypothetical protein
LDVDKYSVKEEESSVPQIKQELDQETEEGAGAGATKQPREPYFY